MSISNRLISSSLILILNQLALRGLGLISTLILARLLTPSDFGIIALVAIVLLFFDLISDAGSQQYLIQKEHATDSDFNTAWTIDLLMKPFLAMMLFLLAPWVATFFDEPELELAIQVIALTLPIKALKNPKLVQLARDFNYKKLVYLQIFQKLASFAVVMGVVVFIETSYWAIIAGDIAAAFIFTFGSYYIVYYKPKWSLSNLKSQWSFSQWLLLRSIVGFSRGQIDIAFISKLFGTSQLGGYHMARELALIPAHNLLIPAIEPLMTAIAQSKNDTDALAYRIRFSLYCLLVAVVPITVFIWFFPYEIITVILGIQWSDYHTLLKYFSLMFLTFPLFALLSDCLIATGKVKTLFIFDLFTTIILFAILYMTKSFSMESFTLIRCCVSIIMTVILIFVVNSIVEFNYLRLTLMLAPIVIVSVLSGFITSYGLSFLDINLVVRLVSATFIYFIIVAIIISMITRVFMADWEESIHIKRLFRYGIKMSNITG